MIRSTCPERPAERGAITLLMTAALVLLMTCAALYVNKASVIEARTARNQTLHTQAFEAAQAGVDRALARLQVGNAAAIPSTSLGAAGQSYAVTLTNRPAKAVLIDSLGCADGCDICSIACPVTARVSQLAGWVSLLPGPPSAAVTARNSVSMGGSTNISNDDARWGGTAVRSGGGVAQDGSSKAVGVAGSPNSTATIEKDTSLAALRKSSMFESTFGVDRDTLRSLSTVIPSAGTECGSMLSGATEQIFWVDGNCALTGNITVGSPTQPVILVVTGELKITGSVTFHGLMYAAELTPDLSGGGNATIVGAVVSENGATFKGSVSVRYDRSVLDTLQASFGTYARLPGGWRDFR